MNIIKLHTTESTNTYLKSLVRKSHLPDQTIVVAENQTQGRGQRANSWYSISGESLTFSVLKQFSNLPADRQFLISMAVSVALCDALCALGVLAVTVKWPNDILSDGKKIGGILIENTLEKQNIKHAVIGIGLNVNIAQFENLPQASSMKILTGTHFALEEVLYSILNKCVSNLQELGVEQFAAYKKRYESWLFRYKKEALFETLEGDRFRATILGVSTIGELRLQTDQGAVKQVRIKQLRMIY